ncbi:polysaccharide deacetylase family protein [Oceaniglobus roseus]|uniref:polysaccharide deacetylase family protein n=1 Tax=Oceaniglobus roseus TaxID=1737570 RepID=UPI000C7F2D52|nr:polysaccharide deacetylase family protein [Kandeliimicrobium roseum]
MIWDPAPYPWPSGKSAAACFSVDVDATSPWLWQHRDGIPAGLAAREHRQYGMRQGFARMVAMLDRLGIRGSFFVPGVVAEENPDLLPGLLARGHEIALHGYYHEIVAESSDARFTEALEAALEVFRRQTGETPKGFRSPAWEMTEHMLSELRKHGLWDSSLMGSDTPYRINGVTEVPVRWDNDDAIFFKFLGGGDKSPRPDREVEAQWASDAAAQGRSGGMFMLTVHDWISGRAARVEMLERVLRPLVEDEAVWFATCGEIAAHHDRVGDALEVETAEVVPVEQRRRAHG